MAAKIFSSPFLPAQAAIRALVPAVKPGHGGGSEAQVLVTHILGRVDALTLAAAGGVPVPAAEADELRGQIERVVELVCPLDVADADERKANAERRAWVEDAFRLAVGHLDL